MTDPIPEFGQVWLGTVDTDDNAGYWPIIGTVSTLSTGTFPPKTTIGDYTKDADDYTSTWIISDLSGGMNIEDMNEGSDTARAWTIFADTRKPGKIALNPRVQRYNWTSSTGTSYPLGVVNDTFYGVIGSEICGFSEANLDFGVTYADEAISLTPVGKPVSFAGRIFVPCGTSGYFYVTESATGNPTVTNVTSGVLTYPSAYDPDVPDVNPPKPAAFWVFDQRLWALTTGGALAWSFTGNDDEWTWPYDEPRAWYPRIESGSTPKRIIGFYNPNGDPTLMVLTDKGLYRFEWGVNRIVDTPAQWPPHPDHGAAVCVWRAGEDLHIGMGIDTWRYTSANVVVPLSGLARDDGVPQELRGKIYDLEPETSEMYALLGPVGADVYAYSASVGSAGTGDGQFDDAVALAVDASGNVWVCDRGNERVQKFNSSLVYQSKFGSLGTGDGQFASGTGGPSAIAIDGSGNLFVVDRGNDRVQKFNSSGTYQSQFGSLGSGNGQFDDPRGIAIKQGSGRIYVADVLNNRIQYFTSLGVYEGQWGSSGSGDGQFSSASRVAVNQDTGSVYVGDTGNDRVQQFSETGVFIRSWGSSGSGDGQFQNIASLAIHPTSGNVLVGDSTRLDIQEFSPTGGFVRKFGSSGTGNGQFLSIGGTGWNAAGTVVYASDFTNEDVQSFTFDTAATGDAQPWLAASTGIGWYGKWRGDTGGVEPTWAIVTSTSTAYRLWWGASDGYLYTTKLKRFFHNPRQALIAGSDEFEEEGEIVTPRFDAAMLGNWKLASHMVVFMENATETEYITIEYRTDSDAGWTLLGTVDSTDKTYLPFDIDATTQFSSGIPFNWIQFRIKLFRGSDDSQTPIIKSLVFSYIKIPQNARSFEFVVAFPNDEWLGRDGPTIRSDLFNLVTAKRMLRLKPWPNESDQEFRGYLTHTNGNDDPEAVVRGQRSVTFIEIAGEELGG